jgi:hypothetical protein
VLAADSAAAGEATTRGLRGAAGFFAAGASGVSAVGVVSGSGAMSGVSDESFMGVLLPALLASNANLHIVLTRAVSTLDLA